MNYNRNILRNNSKKENTRALSFTKPMAYLLHLLSGVDLNIIEKASIKPRTRLRFIPWYDSRKGGGAITLGSSKKASITFTENFFSDDKDTFKLKAYQNNLLAWLRLSSHEVIHLQHAKRYKYLIFYLVVFIFQYIKFGHDNAPLEIEADEGRQQFDRFLHFTRNELRIDFISVVFDPMLDSGQQIESIDFYWNKFTNFYLKKGK